MLCQSDEDGYAFPGVFFVELSGPPYLLYVHPTYTKSLLGIWIVRTL